MKKSSKRHPKEKEMTGEELRRTAVPWSELEAELMLDPEFRKIVEARRPEFELRSALVAERIKGEVTQEEIAKRAGTTQSAIARFESGRTSPTLGFMQRLAEALGKKLEIRLVDART